MTEQSLCSNFRMAECFPGKASCCRNEQVCQRVKGFEWSNGFYIYAFYKNIPLPSMLQYTFDTSHSFDDAYIHTSIMPKKNQSIIYLIVDITTILITIMSTLHKVVLNNATDGTSALSK